VRYAAEADYATWQDRLHVVGLDLRDVGSVEAFCQFMAATFGSVDIVVNNACQTVRPGHSLSLMSLGAVSGTVGEPSLNTSGRHVLGDGQA
jgi:NAD(P)-dependent dehydrogenase (short-subunit alcohol dehydrogenase family)